MNLFVLPNYDKFSGKRLEKRYNDLALYAHEVMHLGFSDMPILSLCDKKMDRVRMISQQLNLLSKADFAIFDRFDSTDENIPELQVPWDLCTEFMDIPYIYLLDDYMNITSQYVNNGFLNTHDTTILFNHDVWLKPCEITNFEA